MFVDARTIPTGTALASDICIVGGGAAGITIAKELVGSGLHVTLVESGDTEYEERTQALYSGTNIGRTYFDPGSPALRLRFLGGTTNHWGGWCARLDPVDFELRSQITHSGWPFPVEYLDPFYHRAQAVVQLGPQNYNSTNWGVPASAIPEPFNGPRFVCRILQVSPPTRFAPVYGPQLRQGPSTTVLLNANALHLNTDGTGKVVRDLTIGAFPDHRLSVQARFYVLAAGGIENARLLLLSGEPGRNGLGNDHDLVGRFFMVHLEYDGGVIALARPAEVFRFSTGPEGASFNQSDGPHRYVSYVCLSDETRRERQLPQLRLVFSPMRNAQHPGPNKTRPGAVDWLGELRSVLRDLYLNAQSAYRGARFGTDAMLVSCSSEQLPNRDSRVALGTALDAFGQREISVDWRLSLQDKRGMLAAHKLLAAEIGRTGLGRFWSSVPEDDSNWPKTLWGNQHQIGTTRMDRDPRFGVVDENCRVHGVDNLYVAGSSVFPTEGATNPTLTIVAMALRLADEIKERVK